MFSTYIISLLSRQVQLILSSSATRVSSSVTFLFTILLSMSPPTYFIAYIILNPYNPFSPTCFYMNRYNLIKLSSPKAYYSCILNVYSFEQLLNKSKSAPSIYSSSYYFYFFASIVKDNSNSSSSLNIISYANGISGSISIFLCTPCNISSSSPIYF